jgi:hypothetical protein
MMMTVGDVLWTFGFGLLIYFFGLDRTLNTKAEVENKIHQISALETE